MTGKPFKHGDRVVATSGWFGVVFRDDGGVCVSVTFPSGTGSIERVYLSPLPPGVVPHSQDASNYVH